MKDQRAAVAVLLFAGVASAVTVVIPEDTKPFKVKEKEVVRLFGKGVAGSTVEAKVTQGKAKVEENTIVQKKGGSTLIGSTVKEFNVTPGGKGVVKVTITVKSPIPGSEPKVTEYEFEVE